MTTLPSQSVVKAYSQASHTVPKTQQIVMLYDGALRFMMQAREAMERGDIETRYNKLVRVGDIIMGLQASLDFEAGGNVAQVLYDFYSVIDMRILALHQQSNVQECDSIIQDLRDMRMAWASIAGDASTKDSSDGAQGVEAQPLSGSLSA